MNYITLLAVMLIIGCKAVTLPDVKPPVITIPPVVIGSQPDKPDTGIACGCKLDQPICDPPYTAQWITDNCRREELAVESEMKIISRFCVKYLDGKVRFLSTVGKCFVKRGANNFGEYKCASKDGYRYHVLGYQSVDPQGTHQYKPEATINKYVDTECRKE